MIVLVCLGLVYDDRFHCAVLEIKSEMSSTSMNGHETVYYVTRIEDFKPYMEELRQ